jgi:hypothetical protein
VTLVLDAGALVAVERGDHEVIALIKRERLASRAPLTHGGIVGQVWRGGRGRQSRLGQLLPGLEVAALDRELGRRDHVRCRKVDRRRCGRPCAPSGPPRHAPRRGRGAPREYRRARRRKPAEREHAQDPLLRTAVYSPGLG